jgi:hypothetical protein
LVAAAVVEGDGEHRWTEPFSEQRRRRTGRAEVQDGWVQDEEAT